MKFLILFIISFQVSASSIDVIKDYYKTTSPANISKVEKYAPIIISIAQQMDFDTNLALSIAWAESDFKPLAESYVGAKGLMQVKPTTKPYALSKYTNHRQIITSNLDKASFEVIENIVAGISYLKYLFKKYEGDSIKTIVSYNMGPTNVYRMEQREESFLTHNYFKKVNTRMTLLAGNYE